MKIFFKSKKEREKTDQLIESWVEKEYGYLEIVNPRSIHGNKLNRRDLLAGMDSANHVVLNNAVNEHIINKPLIENE